MLDKGIGIDYINGQYWEYCVRCLEQVRGISDKEKGIQNE
jgi:hypothetical protein